MLAIVITAIFVLLGLLHMYWSFGGRVGWLTAIPQVSGVPAFIPPAFGTFLVALWLLNCALLIAAVGGLVALPIWPSVLRWLAYGLAAVLSLRAIGDFRLLGFFKRERGSRFARLDTLVYSPLCVALAAGVFFVARHYVAPSGGLLFQ